MMMVCGMMGCAALSPSPPQPEPDAAVAESEPTPPAPVLPTIPLQVGGTTVTAEVADTDRLRARGLMARPALRPDHGMLFVYPESRPRSFWMHNTPLPLSIAYIDENGVIVRIADMEPFDKTTVPSEKPAMYALEMAQGWFATRHIEEGQRVNGLPGPSAQ
ncbi:MAG: DUF192 domain-containing protein [Myxococcota bacterium]